MKKLTGVACLVMTLFVSECVSNKTVSTIQTNDNQKFCGQLQFDLVQLGAKFEDAKDDSGFTGKNVGLGIFFWPGIIVNQIQSGKHQDFIDSKISHLTTIYDTKCTNEKQGVKVA